MREPRSCTTRPRQRGGRRSLTVWRVRPVVVDRFVALLALTLLRAHRLPARVLSMRQTTRPRRASIPPRARFRSDFASHKQTHPSRLRSHFGARVHVAVRARDSPNRPPTLWPRLKRLNTSHSHGRRRIAAREPERVGDAVTKPRSVASAVAERPFFTSSTSR